MSNSIEDERADWTLEQFRNAFEFSQRDLKKERQEHAHTRKTLTEERDMLRYAVKGFCAERLSLRVNIDPSMIPPGREGMWELVQTLVHHHALAAAHEVEEKLGERFLLLQQLDEAQRHILYMERHAGGQGVKFSQFQVRAFR